MKKTAMLTLMLVSASLVGCAAPKIKMQDDHRQSIRTVAIDTEISIPKHLYFDSAQQKTSSNFGLIGMLVGDSEKKRAKKEINDALESRKISVPALVHSAFRNEMAKHTPYKPLQPGAKADATMTMTVDTYGFDNIAFGNRLYPNLTVTAEIKNAEGKAVWRNRARIIAGTKSNKTAFTYEQMIANPARMKKMLAAAARLAAKKAMADL